MCAPRHGPCVVIHLPVEAVLEQPELVLVPELVLDNSTFRDKLRTLEPEPALGAFPVGLCTLKQRLDNPLVAAFWQTAQRFCHGNCANI